MFAQVNTGQVHTSEASNPFGPDKMTQVKSSSKIKRI